MEKQEKTSGNSLSRFVSRRTIKNAGATISLLLLSNSFTAQNNASYNLNTVPIKGASNSAFGSGALVSNTGTGNTANGYSTLFSNTIGFGNTAMGDRALYATTNGYNNTGTGAFSLYNNTTGVANTAFGNHSLYSNVSGYCNTATGEGTLHSNTLGNNNFAGGAYSLYYNTVGSYNTAIGYAAGTTYGVGGYNNTTAIGYGALVTASDQVRIGNSSVTSIGGYQAWSNVSDQRVKKDIEENVPGLSFINKLRPVTYHLNANAIAALSNIPEIPGMKREKISVSPMLHTGLIAQEVEKAADDLGYEFSGVDKPKNKDDLYGLRYAEFTVPLIKAVQELSKENEEMKKELKELKELIKNNSTIGITDPAGMEQSELYQNVPNPFNQSTSIGYTVSSSAKKAVLTISSTDGRKMKEYNVNGKGTVEISAGELSAGVYIYALIVDGKMIASRKITLTQ